MRRLALLAFLPSLAMAQERASFTGEWRGQAQYQATVAGVVDAAAHSVTNLTIALEAGGKVRGASTENGCRLLGIGSPGPVATITTLDVTFSGCQYAGLNRRFGGTLAMYDGGKYVANDAGSGG